MPRREAGLMPASAPSPDDLETVAGWQDVYDFLYEGGWGAEVGEDFTGWNSVYDGSPIPVGEMREWRMATVDRVLSLRPRRVLEIGVGDGHILSQVAPECESYLGTDFSPVAIDAFREQLTAHPKLAERVELRTLPAHEVGVLPAASFDTIIVNSVVQYFPGLDYLATTLTTAAGLLTAGGAIYLGDIRNARTARVLAEAVCAARGAGSPDEVMAADRELLVDPGWFTRFAADRAGLVAVDVRLRRGAAHNELTRHRYDVVLRNGPADVLSLADAPRHRWQGDVPQVPDGSALRLVGVPNTRLAGELSRPTDGPDPEDFHRIGAAAGYRVAVTWSPDDPGEIDVLLVSSDASAWTDVYRATRSTQ